MTVGTQTISVSPDALLEITDVGGDLLVEGWDRQEVQAKGDQVEVQESAGSVTIRCPGDLVISAPHAAFLALRNVSGSLQLINLGGKVEVNFIAGDALFRNISGALQLNGLIGGEARFENIAVLSMHADTAGPGPRIAEHVRRKVEQASRRAQAKIRRVERAAFRHAQAWPQAASYAGAGGAREPGTGLGAGSADSEQERLSILRMLQDRKITSEQADKLLAALEGSS